MYNFILSLCTSRTCNKMRIIKTIVRTRCDRVWNPLLEEQMFFLWERKDTKRWSDVLSLNVNNSLSAHNSVRSSRKLLILLFLYKVFLSTASIASSSFSRKRVSRHHKRCLKLFSQTSTETLQATEGASASHLYSTRDSVDNSMRIVMKTWIVLFLS